MTDPTDAIVAKLMAQIRAWIATEIEYDIADSGGSDASAARISELAAECVRRGLDLESAIREAIDQGPVVAWATEEAEPRVVALHSFVRMPAAAAEPYTTPLVAQRKAP